METVLDLEKNLQNSLKILIQQSCVSCFFLVENKNVNNVTFEESTPFLLWNMYQIHMYTCIHIYTCKNTHRHIYTHKQVH